MYYIEKHSSFLLVEVMVLQHSALLTQSPDNNDTQHNDTQHNDTQHNDTQHNDTQHNDG